MNVKNILLIVLVILALIIIFQNTEVVTFHLLIWQISMSRIVMLSFLLLMGFILGILFTSSAFRGKATPGRKPAED